MMEEFACVCMGMCVCIYGSIGSSACPRGIQYANWTLGQQEIEIEREKGEKRRKMRLYFMQAVDLKGTPQACMEYVCVCRCWA